MGNKVTVLRQLTLFETELTWDELPATVCDEVIQLLATMYIEITDETTANNEEQHDEPTED